ncbi:Putative NAD(P)H nitroreductase YfkO [Anatilimnocola aggregata]|uniref:NAD(P)H nitroreductase YfkO n=1 Tax=Anatilimnocola aggregata TaxID=2528021 RepID=A0A517YMV5_9BACT|nr:NAD(P)H-dependent oxidoreductase [Anatilimnocola aggregata]QDU31555.1 Putative NAD(P)H nitroreductase YfkO [Anatilimnocola aggregata]
MQPVSREVVLEQLKWRYATKKFDPNRKISAEDWQVLAESLVLTPSSFGLQPWKFWVVTNPELKAQLLPLSWNQSQIVDGSHVVVFTARKDLHAGDIDRYLARISEVRGVPVEKLAGFRKTMIGALVPPPAGFDINHWASNQAYIALGSFMTTAAVMGIDACPMEGIQPARYDELLGIAEHGYKTVVACVAGYRHAEDKYAATPKVRFAATDVIVEL